MCDLSMLRNEVVSSRFRDMRAGVGASCVYMDRVFEIAVFDQRAVRSVGRSARLWRNGRANSDVRTNRKWC